MSKDIKSELGKYFVADENGAPLEVGTFPTLEAARTAAQIQVEHDVSDVALVLRVTAICECMPKIRWTE